MYSQTLLSFLLAIAVVTAEDYSFTIHNDGRLSDGEGAIHTWLSIDGPMMNVKYFSFSAASGANPLVPTPGISTADESLKTRSNSENFTASITSEQYNKLSKAMDDFYAGTPLYQLVPNGSNTYNCVTASNYVLQAAGIKTLDGMVVPYKVGTKLATFKSSLTRCLKGSWLHLFYPLIYNPIILVLKCTVV